jgi:uncharacterized coiled-coil DUF342 family protein
MTKNQVQEGNKRVVSEKEQLLEEVEKYRSELSEIYKMVNSLKSAYLQEQRKFNEKLNNESIKIKEENKYLRARLSAYKNSKLGRVTTWYWNFRKK